MEFFYNFNFNKLTDEETEQFEGENKHLQLLTFLNKYEKRQKFWI